MDKLKFNHFGYESIADISMFSLQKQATNNRSDTELSKLDKSIDSITSTKIKVNFNESAFKNQVYFKDITSGEYIKIGLSDENLAKLKSVFDIKDFFNRDDGSTILNGKAESFVGGWFGDIAYKRGYLEADSNSDGFMSSIELMDTYSGFMSEGVYSMTIKADVATNVETYIKFDKNFTQKHSTMVKENKYTSDTIEKELNRTLNSDKNSDGNITYGEIMNKDEHEQDVIDQIKVPEISLDSNAKTESMTKDEVIAILGENYIEVHKTSYGNTRLKWYDKNENSVEITFTKDWKTLVKTKVKSDGYGIVD